MCIFSLGTPLVSLFSVDFCKSIHVLQKEGFFDQI